MKIAFGLVLMMSCTVAANLLMKIGANEAVAGRTIAFGVHWKTVAGLASFGLAGVVYAWVLRYLPLNIAQSFAVAQFIAVILASAILLDEGIPPVRWVGIGLIATGILIVGLTSGD